MCDKNGSPLCFHLTPGQANESTFLDELLVGADSTLFDDQGNPIAWPVAFAADKAYRANWIDEYLMNLGMQPVIPSRETDDREKRAVEFDRELYRQRNIVERVIGWLKEYRRIFSRFEKTAKNFGGMIKMAFIGTYLQNAAE